MTDKEVCPTCKSEVDVQKERPDQKELEIMRQAALILNLKARIGNLEHELEIINSTGG